MQNGTWVTDTSGTLDPKIIAQLNERAAAFERDTSGEIAVVVIRSLDGLTIEDAAVKLFEMWGIGKKHRDNGLLFLWSTGDRRVRVEVGYGLEGTLPDGKVGAILDQYVIPRFKAGQFDQGVLDGVDALIAAARKEPLALASPSTESYDDASEGWLTWLQRLALVPLGLAVLFGFRKWRRRRPRRCPQCQTRMTRLDEAARRRAVEQGGDRGGERRQRGLRRVAVPVMRASPHAPVCQVAEPVCQLPAVPQPHAAVDHGNDRRGDHEP